MIFIVLVSIVTATTLLAALAQTFWLRFCGSLALLLLLAGSTFFSFDAAARRTVNSAVEAGTHSEAFSAGVSAYLKSIDRERLFLVVCGFGLFIVAAVPRRKKS